MAAQLRTIGSKSWEQRTLVPMIAVALLFAVTGIKLVLAAVDVPDGTCPAWVTKPDGTQEYIPAGAPEAFPNWSFVAVGIFSVLLGSFYGQFRKQTPEVLADHRVRPSARILVTILTFLLLLLVTVALAYEALGIARVSYHTEPNVKVVLQPITYFVRCAIYYDIYPDWARSVEPNIPWATYLAVASYCGLIGHWLWWPPIPWLKLPGGVNLGWSAARTASANWRATRAARRA